METGGVERAPEGDGWAGQEGGWSSYIRDEKWKLELGISADKWSGYLCPEPMVSSGAGELGNHI